MTEEIAYSMDREQVLSLSVRELKHILRENSIDSSSCLEKKDIQNLVLQHFGLSRKEEHCPESTESASQVFSDP